MVLSISPSVSFKETDLTTSIPNVATSIGATVGQFSWGPVSKITTVTREAGAATGLVEQFGTPNSTNYEDWFSAQGFLSYASNLKMVRVVKSDATNSSSTGTGVLVKNSDDFDIQLPTLRSSAAIAFLAKYPGTNGNDIVISVADATSYSSWAHKSEFPVPTGTEFHAYITKGGILSEKFTLSRTQGTQDYQGNSMYLEEVFARQSKLVYGIDSAALVTSTGSGAVTYTLSGGSLGGVPTQADYQNGWDLFANSSVVDISLAFAGGAGPTIGKYMVQNIADKRLDCVGFVSPSKASVVGASTPSANIVALRNSTNPSIGLLNFSSSYGIVDGNYGQIYDRYNLTNRWIPLNGHQAGLYARSDEQTDFFYSAAGYNRGQLKNIIALAFEPSKAERDDMYLVGVNPIFTEGAQGKLLFGDKTMLDKPSAFSHVNVRRLFINLEKAISTAAKFSLFEFNDYFTRTRFLQMVEPYLRDIQGRRGIYDFKVVCDETNNTGEVIDRNEFVADIYIKPAISINFINLNFVAVKTAVNFTEVIG